MNKYEITEGNRIIADFMGKIACHIGNKSYHTSWDWLMPVVEKIENTSVIDFWDIKDFSFRISRNHVSIMATNQSAIIYQTPYGYEPESKLQATWIAAVEFIKWHNSQVKELKKVEKHNLAILFYQQKKLLKKDVKL